MLLSVLQRKDLLQLMIDETQEGLEKGEIIADSVGFMLAGYETTSTVLAFATYLLAANPEVQERLANEIHEYFEENPVSARYYTMHYASPIVSHLFCHTTCRTSPCTRPHMSCNILIWCLRRL